MAYNSRFGDKMRCFIAVTLPEIIKEEIEEVQKNFSFDGVKLVEVENFHLTLKFLGEISDEQADRVKKDLEKIAKKTKKIACSLQSIGAFPDEKRPRVVWVGIKNGEKLKELQRNVDESLVSHGFEKEKTWEAHITIARIKAKPPEQLKTEINKLRDWKGSSFTADSIKLMKSTLTKEGAIYEVLASFELV